MSLFQRPIRPPAIVSDQAVERYLEAIRAELAADPLFRHRLRGAVVNRLVAEREGTGPGVRRHMGSLGRAVLYSTFALAVSVTGTMAASQGAAPGDALYPLKLRIEALRIETLPAHFHDELAAHALGERIHELGQLAERGDWSVVAAHAAAVEADYTAYVAATEGDGGSVARHLVVLDGLLDRLPDRAQLAIGEVLDGVKDARQMAGADTPAPPNGNAGQGGRTHSADTGDDPEAEATPSPTKSPKPQPTPRSTRSPRPAPEPPASENSQR